MADPKAPPGGFQEGGWYDGRQYIGGTFSAPGVEHTESGSPSAGQQVSEEVIAQTDPANVAYIQGQQQPQSQEAVTPYLNNFQDAAYQAEGAPEVKVPTMDEIRAQVQPSTPYPEALDRAGTFEELRATYGVTELEGTLNDLKAQEEQVYATLREREGIEEGKPVAMNVIAGRLTEVQKQERRNLEFIQRQINRTVNELNTAYSLVNTYMNFYQLDYQDAVDRYKMEFDQNMAMYGIILDQERLKVDQYYKEQAIATTNLQMYSNAVTSGNLDYGSLSGEQKLMISKLEVQSGLPVGFVGSLRMNPADMIHTINKETGEALIVEADGSFKVVQTGLKPSPSGGGTATERATAKKKDAFAEMSRKLSEVGGDDNLVSPEEWRYYRSQWVQAGFDGSDFDDAYRGIHVDESHSEDYGF